MKAKLAIPPPEDWIQFEIVCKKVWGFVWNIPNEIDFNSTNAQGQQGIDLTGIPRGEKNYFGIQCKNKRLHLKDGTKNKITTRIIDEEIKKAFDFVPAIQHLIIATSLYRDREIEEYIRIKNIEHIGESKFTIQICFWEYISEIIQENQHLYNWYLGQRDFTSSHKVDVVLDNGNSTKDFNPVFIREKRFYRHQTEAEHAEEVEGIAMAFEDLKGFDFAMPWHYKVKEFFSTLFSRKKYLKESDLGTAKILINGKIPEREYPQQANKYASFDMQSTYEVEQGAYFGLIIKNIGANVIEDYKLMFSVDGDLETFEIESPPLSEILNKSYARHSWKSDERKGHIEPKKNFLIQNDHFESQRFYILPKKDVPTKIAINWSFFARDYSEKGLLELEIKPKYKDEETLWYIHPNDSPHEKYYFHNIRKKGLQPFNF